MSEETDRLIREGWKEITHGQRMQGCLLIHEAVQLEPWDHTHYLELGSAYLAVEKPEIAFEYFTIAQLVCPDDSRCWYYAGVSIILHWEQDNILEKSPVENAFQYFVDASRLDPENPHIQCWIGKCYEFLYEWARAKEAYQQVLLVDPGFYTAVHRMGALKSMNN